MPNLSGTPSTTSMPFACSRKISSMVSGRSSRTPSTSPPAGDDRQDAGDRPRVPVAVRGADVGRAPPRRVGVAGVSDRSCQRLDGRAVRRERGQVERQRWRRDHRRDAAPVASAGADLEVGAERRRDLLGHELLERLAGDPPQHLADQVAEVQRVVARGGTRLPPGRLRGEPGGRLVPVVQVLDDGRLVQPGDARGVREEVPDQDPLLARRPRTRASTARPARRRRARRGRPA